MFSFLGSTSMIIEKDQVRFLMHIHIVFIIINAPDILLNLPKRIKCTKKLL